MGGGGVGGGGVGGWGGGCIYLMHGFLLKADQSICTSRW